MANSTTNLDTISSSQASKEVTANALFDAGSPATTYGRRASTTTGLTWGYYGGNVTIAAGTMSQIANGTVALTASQTNYVVAAKSNGAVSASTATTNWDDTDNYWRLYSIVAGASSVTSYTDARQFALYTGLVSFGAMSYQGAWDASTNTPTLASGTGTKGYYYTVSVAGTTSIDGVALWSVGDVIVFNGTVWEKIDGALSEQELGNLIASATEKTTPIDADMVGLMDSAAGNILKKLSWANIKATAKTYFDTLYVAIGGALGTPSSGTVTNLTGTASININGTVGATTPAAGSFTTIGATGIVTTISASNRYDASNASAVAYLFRGAVNVGGGGSLATSDFHAYSEGTATQIGTENAKDFKLVRGGATKLTATATGVGVTGAIAATTTGKVGTTLGVGNATPAASGAGITFPSTQSASTDPNTLDDYEEGTFTPTLIGSTGAGVGTYTAQTGRYTKIGRIVYFTLNIAWSAHTGTGNMRVNTALPLASSLFLFPMGMELINITYTTTAGHIPFCAAFASGGLTQCRLYIQQSGNTRSEIAMDTVGEININGTYFID